MTVIYEGHHQLVKRLQHQYNLSPAGEHYHLVLIHQFCLSQRNCGSNAGTLCDAQMFLDVV